MSIFASVSTSLLLLASVGAQCQFLPFGNGPPAANLYLFNPWDQRSLQLPFPFPFDGVDYHVITVSADGIVALGLGVVSNGISVPSFQSDGPRIAVCWTPPFFLYPTPDPLGVLYNETADQVSIVWHTWQFSTPLRMELILKPSGAFYLHYDPLQAPSVGWIVGVAKGDGTPVPSVDMSSLPMVVRDACAYEIGGSGQFDLGGKTLEFLPISRTDYLVSEVPSPPLCPWVAAPPLPTYTSASQTLFGSGCGAPSLYLDCNLPVVGTNWQLTTTSVPATAVVGLTLIGLGSQQLHLGPLGAPGCYQRVIPGEIQVAPLSGQPAFTQSLHVPLNLNLVGLQLFAQGACFAPGANALGVLTSNGRRGTVGL